MNGPVIELVRKIALLAKRDGGRVLMVGGCVRDEIMGIAPKDIDIEMFGIHEAQVQSVLDKVDGVHSARVGRSFPVWKVWTDQTGAGDAVDLALPRSEIKLGDHRRDFAVKLDPQMSVADASSRRDFTINAIAKDPLTGEVIDPHNGARDLRQGILRHVSGHFVEDPLRVLRGMQFCGRFNLTAAPETVDLCRTLSIDGLSRERIFEEWRKFILKSKTPSKGLDFLEQTEWLRHFPELHSLIGVPQSPRWHPEGDVWTHTKHCLDAFAQRVPMLPKEEDNLVVGLAVLLHDTGKVTHTSKNEEGEWVAHGHESAGEKTTRSFLGRMTQETDLINDVVALVQSHMVPRHLYEMVEATRDPNHADRALRRLSRKVKLGQLVQVCRCDKAGRPPLPPDDPASDWLWSKAAEMSILSSQPKPFLLGRDLIAMGQTPGPAFKVILGSLFERQLDGSILSREEALAAAREMISGEKSPLTKAEKLLPPQIQDAPAVHVARTPDFG